MHAERLAAHARQLRQHVDALSAKNYWAAFEPSPEFVVLFVPGDPFLEAALQADPALLEHAFAQNVVIATPTTLIALLRTVAYSWRQEALARNAAQVHQLGKELHSRLATMGTHVAKLGRSLDAAVSSYNQTVSSLEARVLVSARKLTDLEVADGELPAPGQVERAPAHHRRARAGRVGRRRADRPARAGPVRRRRPGPDSRATVNGMTRDASRRPAGAAAAGGRCPTARCCPRCSALPPWAAVGWPRRSPRSASASTCSGSARLGAVFTVCYVVGCLLAVAWVRRDGLFWPLVQPPLLVAVAVPVVVLLAGSPRPDTGIAEQALVIGAPLVNAFPIDGADHRAGAGRRGCSGCSPSGCGRPTAGGKRRPVSSRRGPAADAAPAAARTSGSPRRS